MKIKTFMDGKLEEIKKLIAKNFPNKDFDSHDFIARFAKEFEPAYVGFLGNYEKNAHRTVHAQIARYLSGNSDALLLRKNGKVKSKSVFAYEVANQHWSR